MVPVLMEASLYSAREQALGSSSGKWNRRRHTTTIKHTASQADIQSTGMAMSSSNKQDASMPGDRKDTNSHMDSDNEN
jgi:hypothetical protein